jgi:hypothetical protein
MPFGAKPRVKPRVKPLAKLMAPCRESGAPRVHPTAKHTI